MIFDAFTFQGEGIPNYFKLGALSKSHWYLVYCAISNSQYSSSTMLLYSFRVGAAEITPDYLIPQLTISATPYLLRTHLLPVLANALHFSPLLPLGLPGISPPSSCPAPITQPTQASLPDSVPIPV